MDVGEDGGDVKDGEHGAVGIRRGSGGSTSIVSSSGVISSCLDRDELLGWPGYEILYF